MSPNDVGVIDAGSGKWRGLSELHAGARRANRLGRYRVLIYKNSRGRASTTSRAAAGFDPGREISAVRRDSRRPARHVARSSSSCAGTTTCSPLLGYVVLLTNYSGSTGFGDAFAQASPRVTRSRAAGNGRRTRPPTRRSAAIPSSTHRSRRRAAQLRWPPCELARGLDQARSSARSHAGLFDLKTQWTTSDAVYERERNIRRALLGRRRHCGAGQSPLTFASKLKTRCSSLSARRLSRSDRQHVRAVVRRCSGRTFPSRLIVFPGREPLDHEGRGQPLLLFGAAGLAGEVPKVARADGTRSRIGSRAGSVYCSSIASARACGFRPATGSRPAPPSDLLRQLLVLDAVAEPLASSRRSRRWYGQVSSSTPSAICRNRMRFCARRLSFSSRAAEVEAALGRQLALGVLARVAAALGAGSARSAAAPAPRRCARSRAAPRRARASRARSVAAPSRSQRARAREASVRASCPRR